MKRKLVILSLIAVVALSTACGKKAENTQPTNGSKPEAAAPAAGASTKAEETYPNAQLLAGVQWANEHLKDKKTIILDIRAKGYEQGHIPGAIAFNSGQLKDAKNNTIVGAEKATELFQNLGINSDTTVLLYDEGNALSAARVFYALEYYGHKDKVKILNGGYAAWLSAGKEVSTDEAKASAKGNFTAVPNPNLITTKDQIKKLDPKQCLLLDTRSGKEYTGEDLRGNQKGGHIAGAVNKEWSDAVNSNSADGVPTFKSYKELKAAFDKVGVVDGKTVIPYCQTNVRGAHSYFTLRLLGYSDIRPYEGSWAEWGNAADTEAVK